MQQAGLKLKGNRWGKTAKIQIQIQISIQIQILNININIPVGFLRARAGGDGYSFGPHS